MLTWADGGAPTRSGRVGAPHRPIIAHDRSQADAGRRVGARRRLVTALFAAATATLLALAATPAPALAGPGVDCPVGQTDCSIWDDVPGRPGNDGGGSDGGGDSGGGKAGKCQWNGREIPCYDDVLGWFNNSDGCYYKLASPQPPETPDGQQAYVATCNGGDLSDQRQVFRDAPPPGFGAPPDPEEIALRLLASIDLRHPRISVAPRKSQGPGLVGLPVWMWANSGVNYFGPLSASDTEGGVTVRIDAAVTHVVWNMGNGVKVTCAEPGTPYSPTGPHAGGPSPDCGYPTGYPKAGTYVVSAVTHWNVHWVGGGQSGDIPVTRGSGNAEIQINELQVVTE
ncbi:hypothetical protein O7606_17830 [Micromonospora sp. WMMD882]|uniref:hypothetical protein n=1 Tax=Micromonospora sp. WMMD882 TaxID=3015151 RepID=UPI00248D0414|nr:hypothetical protein [Micromonospora sp. WMMD882]WBB78100.1 hypothetical protein O7606_17830 [Micromonospora sp. WMMD882]